MQKERIRRTAILVDGGYYRIRAIDLWGRKSARDRALDVASMAYGGLVDQIVLIAGDSDFLPVAKMARRNGVEFILDPMKQFTKQNLRNHVDEIESYTDLIK